MENTTVQPQILANSEAVAQAEKQLSLAETARVKHLISDGVYVKVYAVPKGVKLYNKTFPNNHITILAQGEVYVEDEGSGNKFVAPAHFNFQANKRYAIYTLDDCVWYCIHPTDETDLLKLAEMY